MLRTLTLTTALLLAATAAWADNGSRTPPSAGEPPAGPPLPEGGPLFTENFDLIGTGTGATSCQDIQNRGWFCINRSAPVGTITNGYFQGNTSVFPPQAGTGYIAANFNSTSGTGTISSWLVSPVVTINPSGNQLEFWTRTVSAPSFPDRLEIRASTVTTGTPNVGATATDVGDYTILVATINPTLVATPPTCDPTNGIQLVWNQSTPPTITGYPNGWCRIRITNLPAAAGARFAFRYFVTNGGPSGANSDYIGIDSLTFNPGVNPVADLQLTLSATVPPNTGFGQNYTITPTVTNLGPGAGAGVVATINLPSEAIFQSVATGCTATHAGGVVTWTIGSLANGASVNCPITVRANGFGLVRVTGSVTGTNQDPVPANNSATITFVGAALAAPTLQFWGLMTLLLGMVGVGLLALRRSA